MTETGTAGPILVTGATGNVGGALVSALSAAGVRVRALVRDDAQARALADASSAGGVDGVDGVGRVEAVTGDLNEPESLVPALSGVRAMFLLPGYRDMPGVLDRARQAGVGHVVQLSGLSAASGDTTNAITAYMMRSEQAVTDSGLSHTIVRPSAFMSNALRWLDQLRTGDTVRTAFPDVANAVLDPTDLAAVAAAALLAPDQYAGQVLLPTGPAALRPADQVAILGTALGRPLRFEGLSDEQARKQMESDGTPEAYIAAFFDFYADGSLDESPVRDTVERITGRAPRTFADWAAANADAFAFGKV
jgi:uncharacterized protein YbjT (DUF2867 family)